MTKPPNIDNHKDSPIIQVVMITFNGQNHFNEQINSIVQQSIPCQIDIYDDGSQNAFIQELEKVSANYDSAKVHFSNQNIGVIGNIKRALSHVNRPYVALADQDDVWLPSKLEKCLEVMTETEDRNIPVLVHHDMGIIDQNGQSDAMSFWEMNGQIAFEHTFEAGVIMNLVTGSASLMNEQLAHYTKDIPEDLDIYHDAWLAMVALTMGKTRSIYDQLSNHRRHPQSLTFSNKIKRSLFSKIKTNANELLGLKSSFQTQYDFLDRFLYTYYSELDQYHKNYLKSFLSLKNKSFHSKRKFIQNALKIRG